MLSSGGERIADMEREFVRESVPWDRPFGTSALTSCLERESPIFERTWLPLAAAPCTIEYIGRIGIGGLPGEHLGLVTRFDEKTKFRERALRNLDR
jgi:hypothetical protein